MKASRYAAPALALAILAVGCGSASRPAQAPGSSAVPLSLTTAVTGPGATLAAVPMGGSGGIKLPAQMRAGWFFDTDHWAEGEFFRAQITKARFL
jgi:hypothetical protein